MSTFITAPFLLTSIRLLTHSPSQAHNYIHMYRIFPFLPYALVSENVHFPDTLLTVSTTSAALTP